MTKYTVVIDDDVPLADKKPGAQSRYQHPLSYLLGKLEVGQSFIYPVTDSLAFNGLRSVSGSIGRRTGKIFATRTVKDKKGTGRLRFWRTV